MTAWLVQIVAHWCRVHKEQLRSTVSDKPCIPEALWKCVRLDLADEKLLRTLHSPELDLCLSSAQVEDVKQAAVAYQQRHNEPGTCHRCSRSTHFFYFSLSKPRGKDAVWTEHVLHGTVGWYGIIFPPSSRVESTMANAS